MVEMTSNQARCYSREDLDLFNVLNHPLWVFDVEKKTMWWANTAALTVWNADNLEELLSRNYAHDMSEAFFQTLAEYYIRFQKGEKIKDKWTYYPDGRAPKTLHVTLSGISIDDGRLAMLNEAFLPVEILDEEELREAEMLRQLPMAVCQFDINGQVMHQNPRALELFGDPRVDSIPGGGRKEDEERQQNENFYRDRVHFDISGKILTPNKKPIDLFGNPLVESLAAAPPPRNGDAECKENGKFHADCHFLNRFVDKELGCHVFSEFRNGKPCSIHAQKHTKIGPRWFALKGKRTSDPITANPVIIYGARDITDVMKAKEDAVRNNEEKSEFIAVMGHEIRTPLHQVIGIIELLSQNRVDSEQTELVKLLQSSALSLMTIVNDLLDYTKLEAGKMKLEIVPFDVKATSLGSLAAIKAEAKEKGLNVLHQFPPFIPVKLMGDPNRVRQILLNLLQNAIKFTQVGSITLTIKRFEDDKTGRVVLRWTVSDTGIGISADRQKQLFRKYQQADASVARTHGGTGLGLAICKILAENMGGRVGLDSEVGKGSDFWFELPFAHSSPAKKNGESKAEPPRTSDTDCRLNVLVVEDNIVNQKVQAKMLKRLGHVVTLVDDGKKAVDIVDKFTFDVVLMDVQMPIMDGIEATKLIRLKGLSNQKLPVIGLTASYRPSERQFYQEAGMNLCMSKPLQFSVLKDALSHYSHRKMQMQENKRCSNFVMG